MIQGMGGLMSITGERDDLPGGGPQKAGVARDRPDDRHVRDRGDAGGAEHRDRSGDGQYIDMALLDTQVAMLANLRHQLPRPAARRPDALGNAHQNIVPYQMFAAADGHVIVAVGNDGQYVKFCEVGGRPDLASDARFATNAGRVRNREVLVPLLEEIVRASPCASGPTGSKLPACRAGRSTTSRRRSPIRRSSRGMRIELPHPSAGHVTLVRSPMKMCATPPRFERAPPLLGQHTDEVLRGELGLDDARIAALRAAGIVA